MKKLLVFLLAIGCGGFAYAGSQWGDLSPQQQSQVLALVDAERGYAQQLAKLNNLGAGIASAWAGGTGTIVGSLDSTAIIPNDTGLTAAQPVAPADVTNLYGYCANMSDPSSSSGTAGTGGYNTSFIRALDVKFTGIINTVGQ